MKIAIISDNLGSGGAERQLLLCAAELGKLGHKVKVITYYPENAYQNLVESKGIDVVCLSEGGLGRVGRVLRMARFFRREKFDIVHGFKGTATIYTVLTGKLAGIPKIVGGYRVEYEANGITRFLHKHIDRFLDGWIVNSKGIAGSMVKSLGLNPDKLSVVYNGLPFEDFQSSLSMGQAKEKLGLPVEKLTVTKVARLHKQKNHRMFLEMAAEVLRRRDDVNFLVVGEGPLQDEHKEYAQKLGISESVFFLGRRNDIPDVLAATDIAVLTSNSEGLPNALIEPMCVGIPVVTTDYLGVDELIEDGLNGFIVPRNQPHEMAGKVNELLSDADLRIRMGQEGMRTVKSRYSTDVMADRLVSIYEEIIGRRRNERT